MTALPPFWEAVGFQERLGAWIQSQQPSFDLIPIVVDWIKHQVQNPYSGVIKRQADIAANLWWARIPNTLHDEADVMCSYWIDEEMRQIRCDSIATLARPNL